MDRTPVLASSQGTDSLRFQRLSRFGTIEAIRRRVLGGHGVAVLPRYLVREDLRSKALVTVFPKVTPLHDYFRLVIRSQDARLPIFEAMAAVLTAAPLR